MPAWNCNMGQLKEPFSANSLQSSDFGHYVTGLFFCFRLFRRLAASLCGVSFCRFPSELSQRNSGMLRARKKMIIFAPEL